MSGMDNVSLKVIEDARQVKGKNIQEAEDKAEGIISKAAKKIKNKTTLVKAAAEEHYSKTFDIEVFKVKSVLDQKVLLVKIEIVEDIIEKAKEKLYRLDRKGWEKFLKKMAEELNINKGNYIVGRKEKVLDKSIAAVIKGIKPDKKKADFDRGLKITEGRTEIILSPEKYLDRDIEDIKMEVALHLFDGEE